LLLESTVGFDAKNTVFGRFEFVEKTGAQLVLSDPQAETVFDLGELVLGYLREVATLGSCPAGLGVRGSLNFLPESLEPFYGSRTPAGVMVYLRLRPGRVAMDHMGSAASTH
jgi:hypothetical protein